MRSTSRRVLVVEDDPVINQAVSDRLESEGYDVVRAWDGPGAVAADAEHRPDVVVLDVMLPGFDGHEVCRRIQAARPVPVLMLTARTDEADVLVGLGVGADDYLTKPFRMRELPSRGSPYSCDGSRAPPSSPGRRALEARRPARGRAGPAGVAGCGGGAPDAHRVRPPALPGRDAGRGRHPRQAARRRGDGTAPPAPAPSTATSRACARRSART